MADYAPPPGPPPPTVPQGWKAIWNDQYKEWFYVNTHTKQSQWEKPTQPVYADGDAPPPGAPPGYDHSSAQSTGPEKSGLPSNDPYSGATAAGTMNEDERLARQLQAEEQARARGSDRGASDSYYGQQGASPYGQQGASPYGQQQQQPQYVEADRGKKGGLLGKLTSKLGGGSSSRPPPGYGGGGYPPQGYPPQGYGPPHGYGGYPPQGGYYGQPPPRRGGGGMGAMGGAALGLGGGLLGGALIGEAIEDHDQNEYQDGYQDGMDQGDMGGGDDGGDMGGDF